MRRARAAVVDRDVQVATGHRHADHQLGARVQDRVRHQFGEDGGHPVHHVLHLPLLAGGHQQVPGGLAGRRAGRQPAAHPPGGRGPAGQVQRLGQAGADRQLPGDTQLVKGLAQLRRRGAQQDAHARVRDGGPGQGGQEAESGVALGDQIGQVHHHGVRLVGQALVHRRPQRRCGTAAQHAARTHDADRPATLGLADQLPTHSGPLAVSGVRPGNLPQRSPGRLPRTGRAAGDEACCPAARR